MPMEFPDSGYKILDDAGARKWCESRLEIFVIYLTQRQAPEDITQDSIREMAVAYIQANQSEASFQAIRARCDGTEGLFLGLVINIMSEYFLALVLARAESDTN